MSASDPPPIFTAARVVCRERLQVGGEILTHVETLIDGFMDSYSINVSLLAACRDGASVRALAYLYSRSGKNPRQMAVHVAAMTGHVHVLRWLVQNHCADFSRLREGCLSPIDRAAQHGHLAAVRWLHKHYDVGCSSATLDLAAQCGHLSVLRWLHRHRPESCTSAAMVGAAAHNELRTVRWLHGHNYGDAHAEMLKAAELGHLRVVSWLYHYGGQADSALQAMLAAARCGQLGVVKWLFANAPEVELDGEIYNCRVAIEVAIGGNHQNVVRWLVNRVVSRTVEKERHVRNKRKRVDTEARNTRARLN